MATARLESVFVAALLSGASARHEGPPPVAPVPVIRAASPAREPAVRADAHAAPTAPKKESPSVLPPGIVVGEPGLIPVPEDKPVLVLNAPAENHRAILYLHGKCGDVHAVESWKETATRYGTLIGLLGDRRCGARGRFRWPVEVEPIQARIERALEAVRVARGGLLDTSEPILFGYSQGADRASLLARLFPTRYRRVVLGGPSYAPSFENLAGTQAVAVFGGELETTGHMRSGAEALAASGKPARFFLLPGAHHGQYGPSGAEVMDQVFSWLMGLAAPENAESRSAQHP